MGGTLRLMAYMRLMPIIGPHVGAIMAALFNREVAVFTVFLCFFTVALALGLLVSFGGNLRDYRQFSSAAFNAFQALRGGINLGQLQAVHYVSGTMVFFMVQIFLTPM